jgi:hypothetical protein
MNNLHEDLNYSDVYDCSREEIIKDINDTIGEYGSFYVHQIKHMDTHYIVDSLNYTKDNNLQVYSIIDFIDEGYITCNVYYEDEIIDDDATYYFNDLDIEILEQILFYCNQYQSN